jgi:hypothetical protein
LILWRATRLTSKERISFRPHLKGTSPPFAGDRRLPEFGITLDGSSPPARFGPAAHSDRGDGIEKLPVLSHVAIGAERHQIPQRIIALLASFDPVMDLEIFQ